ncbi:MAG: fibronectin type III domain-containing protein [Planctomycetes bacterium]|nr:fibronectin type III domain-containing protein [Planctomycetota bacterium]
MEKIKSSLPWFLSFLTLVLLVILGSGLTGCKGTGTSASAAAAGSGGGPNPDPSPTPDPGPTPDPAPVTGTASLSWSAPTQNADGSSLSDLNGYYVYYGTKPGIYTTQVDVGKVTAHDVDQLTAGTYYFTVTAYDTSSNESDFSNEVSKAVQ